MERVVEIREELPAMSPVLAIIAARETANIAMLTRRFGRKAALEYMEIVEATLSDPDTLDNVVLIRGEEQRRCAARNRETALNWWRRMSPSFHRAMRKA